MPLSDEEERALQEIARHLSEEDPKLVATVSNTTVSGVNRRRLRYAIGGFIAGFVLLLGLVLHLALAVVGISLMFLSVLVGARAVKVLSEEGGDPLSQLRRRSE